MIPDAFAKQITPSELVWLCNSDHPTAIRLREVCAWVVNNDPNAIPGQKGQTFFANAIVEMRAGQLVSSHPAPTTTTCLFPLCWPLYDSLDKILDTSASPLGFHKVSDFLSCPEHSRLRGLGVQPKDYNEGKSTLDGGPMPLDHLSYGTLIHYLLAARVVHGMDRVLGLLKGTLPCDPATGETRLMALSDQLHMDDALKVEEMLKTYDRAWRIEVRPNNWSGEHTLVGTFEYLGVECLVTTRIAIAKGGIPILRQARYDAVIRMRNAAGEFVVYSLEHKTSSRGGQYAMLSYTPQFWSQVAIWNANPALVARYGKMVGVIPDVLIKTTVPSCERENPRFVSELQSKRAIEYLMLPETVRFPVAPDGSYPRCLHICWGGKYRPCEYIDLCHEGAVGAYEPESASVAAGPVAAGGSI